MAKICYRVPLRSIYIRDIYRPFVSLKNDIVPDYPSRGRGGRRKKTKRWEGGAGKERRAWITMASMRRANREMREYQGGQIIRERPSYFASSHSHPCQHFMRHGIIHPSQIHPRGLISFASSSFQPIRTSFYFSRFFA